MITLEDFVDKIYYINLDTATDRRTKIEQQLKFVVPNHPHKLKRISGVVVSATNLPKDHGIGGPYFPGINREKYIYGSWGCRLAHLQCLEDALKNNYRKIAIFEDDAVFSSDFHKEFHLLATDLKKVPTFEMAWLGIGLEACHKAHLAPPGCKHIGLVESGAIGTWAYIVCNEDRWVIPHLIKNIEYMKNEIDLSYNNLILQKHITRAYAAIPSCIVTTDPSAHSHIQENLLIEAKQSAETKETKELKETTETKEPKERK